ncbi:MAG: hypothetical protein LBE95_02605 [Holosporaceae bacterium]|nr:hypothetical protein [Holosporaceae bacterium]
MTQTYRNTIPIQSVQIHNPCYPRYSSVDHIHVSNGDMLNFSDRGIIGKTICLVSDRNTTPNPLNFTHSGLCILEDPRLLHSTISRLTPNSENKGLGCTIPEKAGKIMCKEIFSQHRDILSLVNRNEILMPFVLEASGSIDTVLRGVYPHVQARPLDISLKKYDGAVYQRSIQIDIPLQYSRDFLETHLGRSYESLGTLSELLRSAEHRNTVENTDKVFCSELCALFYRGVIDTSLEGDEFFQGRRELYGNVSNIIPEQFCSQIGDLDLLLGIAGSEITLKGTKVGKRCLLL